MRFLVKKREAGELELGIIYGTIALIAIGAGHFLPLTELAPACVFRSLTGFCCPTCGITRALVHYSHGQLQTAFFDNPLFTVIVSLTLAYFATSWITALGKFPRFLIRPSRFERSLMIAVAWSLFAANWAYLLLRS